MINTKKDYESPTTNILVLRSRNNILTGSQWDTATPDVTWGDDVDL